MPELPELEVMCEVLSQQLSGRPIAGARAIHPGLLKTVDPPLEALAGRTFETVSRRGKHLILSCSDDLHIVVHLMLAGRWIRCGGDTKVTRATGFVVSFEDGEDLRIIENGTKRRVRVHVVRDPLDVEHVANAGIEPLIDAFTVGYLSAGLGGLRRQLKKAITHQPFIAGIGSAYADEALFAAKLSPIRYASTLSTEEIKRLHTGIQETLSAAIEEIRSRTDGALVATHDREFLQIYKRTGEPCPECGTKIEEIRYAQKKIYYCPSCQASDKILPDRRSWLTK